MWTSLPIHEARHVLWVFDGDNGLGLAPGNFITKLLEAAAVADSGNLDRLEAGFPDYIRLVRMWKFEVDGAELIREMVRNA